MNKNIVYAIFICIPLYSMNETQNIIDETSSDEIMHIAGGERNDLVLTNHQTGETKIFSLSEWPIKVLFSPDSKHIAATTFDKKLFLIDATNKEFTHITQYKNALHEILFSPNSKCVAARSSHKSFVVDVDTGENISATSHDDEITQMDFLSDSNRLVTTSSSRLATTSMSKKVLLFDIKEQQTKQLYP